MIKFLDLKVVESPVNVARKYLIEARFIDTDNPDGYDKCFQLAGDRLNAILKDTARQATIICCCDDPYDIDYLNKAFQEARE